MIKRENYENQPICEQTPPPVKPARMQVLVDHIPQAIRALLQWVVWRWIFRPSRNGHSGKWDKPPYQTNGRCAKSNDPETWNSLDQCLQAVQSGKFDGVGFVLTEGLVGIDLDDCRDPTTGEISEPAASIIRELDTYAEISPSGTGVKMVARAKLPAKTSKVNHEAGIEVYENGRYFTITGHLVPGSPDAINERQQQVEWLLTTWVAKGHSFPRSGSESKGDTDRDEMELARAALAGLKPARADNYDEWLKVGMALKSVSGDLLADWIEFSKKSDKFRDGEPERKWNSFKSGGLGLGTLIHMAKADSWKPPRRAEHRQQVATTDKPAVEACTEYVASDGGIFWNRPSKDGVFPVRLTNFDARIIGEVERDDGVSTQVTIEIEARVRGRIMRFSVPAHQFASMNWVTEKLGTSAIVEPGQGLRERLRHAMQVLSAEPPRRVVYGHLGWRPINGVHGYLHAGGAIGPNGPIPGVEIGLPDALRKYVLPPPPEAKSLVEAVQASLRIVEVAPRNVTMPLLAALWRAVLKSAVFGVWLVGRTGVGKSELAALALQHFGPGLANKNFPGNWSSTSNALEALAFAAKDALLVVDDFAPSGSPADVARYHAAAERILRGQGNQAGRQRLGRDTDFRADKYPRGLILSTGEDVANGHSIRARNLILEVGPNDIDWARLTDCQEDARNGRYASAMAGFLQWLAGRYESIQDDATKRVPELRQRAFRADGHRRTPELIAELAYGWDVFLQFCIDTQSLTQIEADDLRNSMWDALGRAAVAQTEHQTAADPVSRFLELLRSALLSERAHLAGMDGREPDNPATCGWRQRTIGTGSSARDEWQPQGDRIGWVEDGQVYLQPEAAFRTAQTMAGPSADGLPVGIKTLFKRLNECGVLASCDKDRNTMRKLIQGERYHVLHLRWRTLVSHQSGQTSHSARHAGSPVESQDARPDSVDRSSQSADEIGPHEVAETRGETASCGPEGPIGPSPEQYTTNESEGWGAI